MTMRDLCGTGRRRQVLPERKPLQTAGSSQWRILRRQWTFKDHRRPGIRYDGKQGTLCVLRPPGLGDESLRESPLHAGGCKDLCRHGLYGSHLIAMQGPFSKEMNEATLRQYECQYLVTKDSGKAGGFRKKSMLRLRAV